MRLPNVQKKHEDTQGVYPCISFMLLKEEIIIK